MKPIYFYKIALLSIFLSFVNQTFSQVSEQYNFYKHFTGKLDTTMNLTLDLLSHNGTISGYYYYSFAEPGSPSITHYGKTISISGTIDKNNINFKEFNNTESQFSGTMENDETISGFWQKSSQDKTVPFIVEENYSKGSIPLSCYAISDEHILFKGDGAEKTSPKAKININILFPAPEHKSTSYDSLKKLISKYLNSKNETIKSPDEFVKDLKNSYFDSYIKSSEGIADMTNAESFNQEKNIMMQVAYNENSILSFILRKFAKTGNSSGIEMVKYFVFSSELNRQIALEDFMTTEGLSQLDDLLNKKLRKLNGIKEEESLVEAGFFSETIKHNNNFYINNDGVGFLYNVYEIAPGSLGITSLFISFKELSEGMVKLGILP